MKRLTVFVITLLFFIAASANEVKIIDVQTLKKIEKNVSTSPKFDIRESVDTLKVSMSFRYFRLSPKENGKSIIMLDGFSEYVSPGEPRWIYKTLRYPVKDDMYAQVIVRNVRSVDLAIDPKMGKELNYADDNPLTEGFSQNYGDSPTMTHNNSIVTPLDIQYYRGHGFLPIVISPIQYNVKDGIARVNYEISYDIVYSLHPLKLGAKEVKNIHKMEISKNDNFLNDFTEETPIKPNNEDKYKEPIGGDILPAPPTKPGYLILSSSVHTKAAAKLANWKILMGYDVKVVGRPGIWTEELIKEQIKSYKNSNGNFYYLMLIGNHTQMPGKLLKYVDPNDNKEIYYYSDFEYACLDYDAEDEDNIPDVYYGRIPASTSEESIIAVDKIISYEKDPVMDNDFYKSAFHASGFTIRKKSELPEDEENTLHIYSSEMATIAMRDSCDFNIKRIYAASENHSPKYWSKTFLDKIIEIPKYLQRPNFNWDGCAKDVVDEINKGSVYGLYMGHGHYSGWHSELDFFINDIKNLHNKNKYPIIFSFACKTGGYDQGVYCFSNELLFAKESGAAAVIASSQTSYTPYNEIMAGAMLRAIYPKTMLQIYKSTTTCNIPANAKSKCLGEALNYATTVLETIYPQKYIHELNNPKTCLLVRKEYHCFGDPSIKIKSSAPKSFDGILVFKDNDGFIIVGDMDKFPNDAIVSVVDTTFNSNTIIAYERIQNLRIKTSSPNGCKICISHEDYKPYCIDGKNVKYYDPDFYNRSINNYEQSIFDYNDEYIDFATGKRHDANEEKPKWRSGYDVRQKSDGGFEVTCNYANIISWEMQPNKEGWDIPDSEFDRDVEGFPILPTIVYSVNKNSIDELNQFYVENCDFIDIENVDCMAGWSVFEPATFNSLSQIENSNADTRGIFISPIMPYSGFWPCENEMVFAGNDGDNIKVFVRPLQYDMENKVMRVNRKITIGRGVKEAAIKTTDSDNIQCIYLTTDGRIEPNPKRGNIYIKKSGEKYSKVIF